MSNAGKSILLLACLCSTAALAQVQVVEAGSDQSTRNRGNAAAPNNNQELLVSLYNQLTALQQEVQSLRGTVEEQGYQLKRLEKEQKDRYMDIDRRLIEMSTTGEDPNAPVSTAANEGTTPSETAKGDVRTTVPYNPVLQSSVKPADTNTAPKASVLPSLNIDQLSEQDLYRTALNLLLDEGNSTDSITLFQNYIDRFPTGQYLPNCLYWQGEAYILLARYPQARDVFERVLRDFPTSQKAAGSMLKLGVVYNLMGDRTLAEQTWRDLQVQYPDSTSELGLAKEYLNKK